MSLVPSIANPPDHLEPAHFYPHAADDTAKIFLIDVLAAIHRNRKLALVAAVLAVALVLGVTLSLTPLYQSTASIMLDTRREQVVDMQAVLSSLPSDTFVVDSEVQVLQSPALARRVVAKLHLDQDPEFNATLRPQSPLSIPLNAVKAAFHAALAWFGQAPTTDVDSAARHEEAVVQAVEKNLSVSRQGLTYVINIAFQSQDAGKVVRIANANMANALRLVSTNKGYDPRDFALMAFGGGGPMHAVALARELKVPRVIVPVNSAVFSAWGMLLTDLRRDYVSTHLLPLDGPRASAVVSQFRTMEAEAVANALNKAARFAPGRSWAVVSVLPILDVYERRTGRYRRPRRACF